MSDESVPLENLIQAITAQLDRAQEAMALKARLGTQLTFAVRDLVLDLRTHVEVVDSTVRVRPAGPGETDTSVLHMSLTSITRPMIEENTRALSADYGAPSIKDAVGSELTQDEQARLEWAGVYTVSQLKDLQSHTSPAMLERVAQLPVGRLQAAMRAASQPRVTQVERLEGPEPTMRISGINFDGERAPVVRLGGADLPVLKAGPRELLVSRPAVGIATALEVETSDGIAAYELPPDEDEVAS